MKQETEIKVRVDSADLSNIRERLLQLGFKQTSARQFEQNWLFDFADSRLTDEGCALRLRSYGKETLLTFKGPRTPDSELKIREEIETQVGEFDAALQILERLGLTPCFRYDKYREKFVCDAETEQSAELCIDETPFGCFIEVEGEPETIQAVADEMNWPRTRYISANYIDLYKEHGFGT